jgi:hypothetical protein
VRINIYMNLADLVGNHYLSGVEHGNETYKIIIMMKMIGNISYLS